MREDAARQTALDLLRAVRADEVYANLALPSLLSERHISGRDAAFATELAYGTLRWRGWYDAIIDACVARQADDVELIVRDVLRLGVHQLLAMRVPAHAAIDSSVTLARYNGNPGSARGRAGFVNAVLRKVNGRSADEWAAHLGVEGSDSRSLSVRWSHPEWIVRAFSDALGSRRAELPSLLAADNVAARPSLVARPGRITVDELLALPGVEPGTLSPFAARLTTGAPESLPPVFDGRAGVQDEGSQLVALALTRAEVFGQDTDWLDMCAGPGGKAALLAGLAHERGAVLTAVELHAHRAGLVRRSVGDDVDVIVGDATTSPWGSRRFDRVLLDAPCTGLGALRRRPEARWRRMPADLASLGPLQRALLTTAADATKVGGVIGYVTCSPHLAETEFVVSDVLKRRDDLELEDAHPLLPEVSDAGEGPMVQLWPHRHGTDGMFLAVLRKR